MRAGCREEGAKPKCRKSGTGVAAPECARARGKGEEPRKATSEAGVGGPKRAPPEAEDGKPGRATERTGSEEPVRKWSVADAAGSRCKGLCEEGERPGSTKSEAGGVASEFVLLDTETVEPARPKHRDSRAKPTLAQSSAEAAKLRRAELRGDTARSVQAWSRSNKLKPGREQLNTASGTSS